MNEDVVKVTLYRKIKSRCRNRRVLGNKYLLLFRKFLSLVSIVELKTAERIELAREVGMITLRSTASARSLLSQNLRTLQSTRVPYPKVQPHNKSQKQDKFEIVQLSRNGRNIFAKASGTQWSMGICIAQNHGLIGEGNRNGVIRRSVVFEVQNKDDSCETAPRTKEDG